MKQGDKNRPNKPDIRTGKQLSADERENLKQYLIFRVEEKRLDKFTDKKIDRENEKFELINGRKISSKEIEEIISKSIQPYAPKFTRETEFYKEMYRLNPDWPQEEAYQYPKRSIVGKYTNEVIYFRFSAEILPLLQELNPYVLGRIRRYKHFQCLTGEASVKVDQFIQEAVKLMKKHTDWYEFRIEYWKKFNVPFQTDLYKDNSNVK